MLAYNISESSGATSEVMFSPDIFKTAMDLVVNNHNIPSRRIGGDRKWRGVCESNHRRTKLFRFPRLGLRFRCSIYNRRDWGGWGWYAHLLDRVSSPKGFDFPLLIVRRKPQVRNTDIRFPFPPQGPEQDEHTTPLSVHEHRRRFRCKCSGSCRSLASVFHLRRWMKSCRSK